MSDLLFVAPDFPTTSFSNIIPSLEKNHITVADLLTLDAVDIARRAQLPAREVRRLTEAIVQTLQDDLGLSNAPNGDAQLSQKRGSRLHSTGTEIAARWSTISFLDDTLDAALGGGIPTGYITEIVGESGAGKTQLLLTLLLAVQLPSAQGGISRSAIYISTEAPLQTSRLSQMLKSHPILSRINRDDDQGPSLARVLSIQTPDLESQEHILRYQLPIAIRRHNVGLVIIDSITANYRAEFTPDTRSSTSSVISGGGGSTNGPAAMVKRTAQLLEVATLLRDLARTEDVAVVVANQVADRFDHAQLPLRQHFQQQQHQDNSRPASAHGSQPSPSSSFGATTNSIPDELLSLDHQQRFFTGWGDARPGWSGGHGVTSGPGYKTPSLGLVWANQIACRLALVKTTMPNPLASTAAKTLRELEVALSTSETSISSQQDGAESLSTPTATTSRWRRHLRVVFAPWAKSSDGERGVELVIWKGGVKAVVDA